MYETTSGALVGSSGCDEPNGLWSSHGVVTGLPVNGASGPPAVGSTQ